jgi:hypothetical protein
LAASRDWFDLKLLRSDKDPTVAIKYDSFLSAVRNRLEAIGLNTRAQTHIFRGFGARMADLGGASHDQIRSHGRWNNEAVDRCYLTGLARETLRVHAGFDAKGGGFWIKRDLPVPEELTNQVFPEAVEWCVLPPPFISLLSLFSCRFDVFSLFLFFLL